MSCCGCRFAGKVNPRKGGICHPSLPFQGLDHIPSLGLSPAIQRVHSSWISCHSSWEVQITIIPIDNKKRMVRSKRTNPGRGDRSPQICLTRKPQTLCMFAQLTGELLSEYPVCGYDNSLCLYFPNFPNPRHGCTAFPSHN